MSEKDEKKSELLDSPHIGGLKMSSNLKERLKRSSRSFSCPLSRSVKLKTVCVKDGKCRIGECSCPQNAESSSDTISLSQDDTEACNEPDLLKEMDLNLRRQVTDNEEKMRKLRLEQHYHANIATCSINFSYTSDDVDACNDRDLLEIIYYNLEDKMPGYEEKLRKFKLVEHYHMKNKPNDLVQLIKKWLTVAQDSVRKLYELLPEEIRGEFKDFLSALKIDPKIIQYNCDSDTFY